MRTAVTTNGLLLTERRLSELVGLVDVLAISLDGRPETHDWMRGDRRAFGQMSSRLPAGA
jgi:MoaA/NifB/PqqE/SkfB family radical SAM enzyme